MLASGEGGVWGAPVPAHSAKAGPRRIGREGREGRSGAGDIAQATGPPHPQGHPRTCGQRHSV